ncbi:d-xylulose reductase a [Trichoderma arundinaceum]|uniref:D-xylulose reductase a n=1 Tax=Trichoderma arundinaceum TaxID=490622 RepID=A0A395NLI9_TRIAR|nr:d-xylulose reductase a [Trichoderma arundinaceum]
MARRRATSQIASPIVDFDVAIAEKPFKKRQSSQPVEDPKCYYIVNPRTPNLAWYLTKGKDNSKSHEYEVEKVPTHLVRIRQNRIGYLIETANGDEVAAAAGERPASWTPKCQNGWSTAAISSLERVIVDTEAEPGKRVNRFERWDSAEEIKSSLDDEPNIILNRRDIPLITKSIVHHLHTARQQQHFCTTSGGIMNDEASSSEEERCLETAIETTLLEFRRSMQCGDISETDEEDVSPQSKLPTQFALNNGNRSIKLRPSVAADPAITLSIPQTSFTMADDNHKHNGTREGKLQEPRTMTTLVSPQSITAITWAKLGGHLGEPSESQVSTDSPSDEISESTTQTRQTSSCHGHDQDQDMETSQASLGASSIASTITSFPKLLSRHCTREWIKPVVNLEDPSPRPSTTTGYSNHGADAHTTCLSHHHTTSTESPVPKSWAGDSFRSHNSSGYFTNRTPNTRRSTLSQSALANPKSFGSHIGSAAHRRRSTPTCDPKTPDSQDHFFPSILGKFFIGNKTGTPGSPDSKETTISGAKTPYNSPAPGHMPATTPRSEDEALRERTRALSEEDKARIHDALVRSSAVADRRRRNTCSEDNRPHVCKNDMDHRVR